MKNKSLKQFIEESTECIVFIGPKGTLMAQTLTPDQSEYDTGLNARDLIDDYFEGTKVPVTHPSGDPTLETLERLSGTKYVYREFMGDYEKALEHIVETESCKILSPK